MTRTRPKRSLYKIILYDERKPYCFRSFKNHHAVNQFRYIFALAIRWRGSYNRAIIYENQKNGPELVRFNRRRQIIYHYDNIFTHRGRLARLLGAAYRQPEKQQENHPENYPEKLSGKATDMPAGNTNATPCQGGVPQAGWF